MTKDLSEAAARLKAIAGLIGFMAEVPERDRGDSLNDIAEIYAVEIGDNIPGGCIIWGYYNGEWQANVSGRWLVSRFLKGTIATVRADDDEFISLGRLRSIGFTSDGPMYTTWSLRSESNPGVRIKWNDKFDRVEFADVVLLDILTMGQLRRLCEALGVEVKA